MKKRIPLALCAALALNGCALFPDDFDWPEIPTNAPPIPDPVPDPGVTKLPRIPDLASEWVTGSGAVNFWYTLDQADVAEAHARRGVGIVSIEMLGWAKSPFWTKPEQMDVPFRQLVGECRLRNLILFISIANDNKGEGKYGDDRNGLNKYGAALDRALSLVEQVGPANLIVQPVAETKTSTGKAYQDRVKNALASKGYDLCYNGGSRPTSAPSGYKYFAFHPTSTDQSVPRNALCVSDTGAILRQARLWGRFTMWLQGGDVYGNADPVAMEAYARKMKAQGTDFIDYGFGRKTLDIGALDALQKAGR